MKAAEEREEREVATSRAEMRGEGGGTPGKVSRRREVLERAADIISGSRHEQYGGAEDSFRNIARYWNVHLLNAKGIEGDPLDAVDVAIMMDLLKTARLDTNPQHGDSWVDKGGYVGCGFEIACPTEEDER